MKHTEAHALIMDAREVCKTAPIHVIPLAVEHLPAFLTLRLNALRQHPEAFVPTWEEERAVNPATMASRFRNDWVGGGSFILGVWIQGRLVGAIAIRRWPRVKQRHKANVWLLFIEADLRCQGIGRYLLEAAISRCRNDGEVELLHLSVSTESAEARRLYAEAGFRSYGIEPRALRLDDRYVDVELMALEIDTGREH